ncbi:MAG: AzlC family ABC transporter permease [Boseongicola sp.]
MASTTRKSAYIQGLIAGLPFLPIGIPFAVLFGVVATEAGLDVAQTVGFSVLVIAGAAQFTAIQLMTEAVPVWSVLAASLGVNLRMAMYSASLQPHLGAAPLWQRICAAYLNVDASYALGIQKFEEEPDTPVGDKIAFFVGTMVLMGPLWTIGTLVGAVTGDSLPDWVTIDFAMPLLFLSIVGPMLKTLAHLFAAVTSIVVALIFGFLPSGIGLLIAAFAAMAVGAEIERRRGR